MSCHCRGCFDCSILSVEVKLVSFAVHIDNTQFGMFYPTPPRQVDIIPVYPSPMLPADS